MIKKKISLFIVVMVVMVSVFGMTSVVHSDIVQYFDQETGQPSGQVNSFTRVPEILYASKIGSDNYESEAVLDSYRIQNDYTDLTFTLYLDGGDFEFDFGYYKVNTITADPVTEKEQYATQALAPGNAAKIFDDRIHNEEDQVTVNLANAGITIDDIIAFFIIPNNTLEAFQADSPAFYDPGNTEDQYRSPLFSCSSANPGEHDQMLSFDMDVPYHSLTLFLFEDMSRALLSPDPEGSDWDFDDVSFKVEPRLIPVPEPVTASVLIMGYLSLLFRRRTS